MQTTLTLDCAAYDAYGNWVGGASANQLDPRFPWTVGSSLGNAAGAVTVCGTVYAESPTWQAHGSRCLPVVPGGLL